MNSLLPNGNILAAYGAGNGDMVTSLVKEIHPSDPDYEAYTFFMTSEDEKRALAILETYRRTHAEAS